LKHDHAPHWTIAFFTLFLAVFAFFAWLDSTATTAAIQGQLNILREENRPFVFVDDAPLLGIATGPQFKSDTGQITWNYPIRNFGKSVAYHLGIQSFMKIGDGGYQLSDKGDKGFSDLPPTGRAWATVYSPEGLSKDYFETITKKLRGVWIRVVFTYHDASLRETYVSAFCMVNNGNGTFSDRTAEECKE